jgi:hypothetical protein
MNEPRQIESIQPCSGHYSPRADLRLSAWLAVATVLYVLVLLVIKYVPALPPWARGLLSLSPLLPGLLYVRSWARLVRGLDELQRAVQVEAFLFAALGTVIVAIVVNTLNASGVAIGGWQHGLGIGGAFCTMFTLWLVGGAIANRRYR